MKQGFTRISLFWCYPGYWKQRNKAMIKRKIIYPFHFMHDSRYSLNIDASGAIKATPILISMNEWVKEINFNSNIRLQVILYYPRIESTRWKFVNMFGLVSNRIGSRSRICAPDEHYASLVNFDIYTLKYGGLTVLYHSWDQQSNAINYNILLLNQISVRVKK